jgi:purine-binding chemotaxis protein CheW
MNTDEIVKINSYLSFKLGEELYAINVKNVINIVELSKITKVPRVPEYMLGIINLRGIVLPVIDARKKFGLPEAEYTVNTCILVLEVVVNNSNVLVGALVDGVKEVLEIDAAEINNPPSIGFNSSNFFITGVYKKNDDNVFILILDIDAVFSTDEILAIDLATDLSAQKAVQ